MTYSEARGVLQGRLRFGDTRQIEAVRVTEAVERLRDEFRRFEISCDPLSGSLLYLTAETAAQELSNFKRYAATHSAEAVRAHYVDFGTLKITRMRRPGEDAHP